MKGNTSIAAGLVLRLQQRKTIELSIDSAGYWRSRAEEARALAEMLEDPEAKRMMMDVVEGYERLATHAEASQKQCKPEK
jgi:LAS superfamily LD-carboxypeptidase LdcB